MPLQGQYSQLQTGVWGSEALFRLIMILEDPDLLAARVTNTIRTKRLISVYSETAKLFRPNLIRRIMAYYWNEPFKKALLEKLEKFEKYLLALGKREHFVHQFEVMLLGLNLIKSLKNNITNARSIFGFDSWQDIYYTWTITAMGHDFGYPFEVGSEFIRELSSLYNELHMERISEHLRTILHRPNIDSEHKLTEYSKSDNNEMIKEVFDNKQFLWDILKTNLDLSNRESEELVTKLKFGVGENQTDADHGYISALLLCRSVIEEYFSSGIRTSFNEFTKRKRYKMLEFACGAIATHNLGAPYRDNISFQRNPFAFILHLLDNIHDWNRTIFGDKKWPNYELSKFALKGNVIEIEQYLWDEHWPDDMLQRVKDSLFEKKRYLENLIGKPDPPLSNRVNLTYIFSTSRENNPFTIEIAL